ncbi:hypothetical protein MSG28_006272 [Choristoneura fumiferana]|uniref:Uncharacterized protein n=1 Tax=Choristoneura fumiferana TaxID=7141 RepID=A0ACC0JEB0_CHOFU|nr:hypothetical protein MSG28_006272 [Choristoneura fumiferana]
MRAFVAILTLAVWPCCAYAPSADLLNYLPRSLLAALHIEGTPLENLVACSQTLGPLKCLQALSAWRATNAADILPKQQGTYFNLTEDIKRFPWKKYSNRSQEQIYSELCFGTEKMLQYRSLKLNAVPGYSFELKSKKNGNLNIDVYSNDENESGRSSMKKLRKQFYSIAPLLLVPGLIMSAILPFVLPALKMSVVAAGMLNNMALSSAVFTLLRNNAFNDRYEKKVVYVNAGWRNKKPHLHEEETQFHNVYEHSDNNNNYFNHVSENEHQEVVGEDFDNVEDIPSNTALMDNYYGSNNKFVNIIGYKNRIHEMKKRRKNRKV